MSHSKGSTSRPTKGSTPKAPVKPSSHKAKGSSSQDKGSSSDKGSTPRTARSSSPPVNSDALQPIDENFLQQLRVGAHLFHYPRQGDAAASFQKSPSAEYTMYSVIDVPTENDIVLTRSFDEEEEKKTYTWDDLLAGEWWYNPEAPHQN